MLGLQQFNKPYEKAQKEKKKKQYWKGQKYQKNSISTTKVNVAKTGEPYQKKKKIQKYLDKNLNMVTCFNYAKKGHYANTCIDQPKN